MKTIWIVTYWDDDDEPVVALFDNQEAANECYEFYKEKSDWCYLNTCSICNKFTLDQDRRRLLEKLRSLENCQILKDKQAELRKLFEKVGLKTTGVFENSLNTFNGCLDDILGNYYKYRFTQLDNGRIELLLPKA